MYACIYSFSILFCPQNWYMKVWNYGIVIFLLKFSFLITYNENMKKWFCTTANVLSPHKFWCWTCKESVTFFISVCFWTEFAFHVCLVSIAKSFLYGDFHYDKLGGPWEGFLGWTLSDVALFMHLQCSCNCGTCALVWEFIEHEGSWSKKNEITWFHLYLSETKINYSLYMSLWHGW